MLMLQNVQGWAEYADADLCFYKIVSVSTD